MDEIIEVLDEEYDPKNSQDNSQIISLDTILNSNQQTNENNSNSKSQVISFDRLFDKEEEDFVVDAYEEDLKKEQSLQKKITRVQIGLLIFLFVFGTLVYFFGYDFFEPYIKID